MSIKKHLLKFFFVFLMMSILFSTGCEKTDNEDYTANGGEGDGEENKEDGYSDYCQILQNILKNDQTRILIEQRDQDKISIDSPYFQGIPFHFIEQQGHDVAKVKSGEFSSTTISFIKDTEPNNLYMLVSVENEGDFCTQYLVVYTLTDKEIKDYKSMHGVMGDWYYQAAFMNDEISKNKTPLILSKVDITNEAYENLNDKRDGLSSLNSTKTVLKILPKFTDSYPYLHALSFLKDFDIENQSFNAYSITGLTNTNMVTHKGSFTTFPLVSKNRHVEANNGVFVEPSIWGDFKLASSVTLEWPAESITVFDSSEAFYRESNCTDLVHELKYRNK